MLDARPEITSSADRLLQPLSDPAADGMPAIVVKAQEDARCRLALTTLGYGNVRSAYAKHKRARKTTFEGLASEDLWPAMDLVRDWLKEERNRIIARVRWPFLLSMLATIVGGLAFVTVAAMLG